MDQDQQRDPDEERYWAEFCPECGESPCRGGHIAIDVDSERARSVREFVRDLRERLGDPGSMRAREELRAWFEGLDEEG